MLLFRDNDSWNVSSGATLSQAQAKETVFHSFIADTLFSAKQCNCVYIHWLGNIYLAQ